MSEWCVLPLVPTPAKAAEETTSLSQNVARFEISFGTTVNKASCVLLMVYLLGTNEPSPEGAKTCEPYIIISLGSSNVESYQDPPDGYPFVTAFVKCSRWVRIKSPNALAANVFACARFSVYILAQKYPQGEIFVSFICEM